MSLIARDQAAFLSGFSPSMNRTPATTSGSSLAPLRSRRPSRTSLRRRMAATVRRMDAARRTWPFFAPVLRNTTVFRPRFRCEAHPPLHGMARRLSEVLRERRRRVASTRKRTHEPGAHRLERLVQTGITGLEHHPTACGPNARFVKYSCVPVIGANIVICPFETARDPSSQPHTQSRAAVPVATPRRPAEMKIAILSGWEPDQPQVPRASAALIPNSRP